MLVDEAHRSQYGGLAANLRKALPNGCLFGFTGTPIDKNDRSTLHTFGSYTDTYTIEQAVESTGCSSRTARFLASEPPVSS